MRLQTTADPDKCGALSMRLGTGRRSLLQRCIFAPLDPELFQVNGEHAVLMHEAQIHSSREYLDNFPFAIDLLLDVTPFHLSQCSSNKKRNLCRTQFAKAVSIKGGSI